ncbi:MAG: vanadium-dependent haloperoxidase [Gemmatimonadaceae bacterium]|nr:vanadium-dependent haloperoxidase [Chitinophagaceae bacterium]
MSQGFLKLKRQSFAWLIFSSILISLIAVSCRKPGKPRKDDVSYHSSKVVDSWITLQLRLIRNATGIPNQAFARHFVYSGIAAFESVAPGLDAVSRSINWNGLTGLPQHQPHTKYYWPANVNAALAGINRSLFVNASEVDKSAIDSLENAWNIKFENETNAGVLTKSIAFGKSVATAVFNWSETDGYKGANAPYTPPVGDGLWVSTPPAFALAGTPFFGKNRPVVEGSTSNVQPPAPPAYSTDPKSEFYKMVSQVYEISLTLTDDQKAMAMHWRDIPGVSSPGHWLSILQQVMRNQGTALDKAVFAYAVTGASINDGLISCWESKFKFNLIRPITYIRTIMGQPAWNSFLTTPNHPEYSSAHAVLSAAAADALQRIFGNSGSFTDHTYDYLGFGARNYPTFKAIGVEAGQSRLYAGIHYQKSIDEGLIQGRKVVANIFR